jgi:hypothetical protein
MAIKYGTHGSETQEEAEKRFWVPACKYADKLFAEKVKRNKSEDMERRTNGRNS